MKNIGQAGSTICLGLIFDMIIVRMFLVMPLARLLGRWFWWPQRRNRFERLISQRADATSEVAFEVTTRLQTLPEQRCDARLNHV